ncbi:unnamed protein product [Rhodiola kirilowii]
MGRRKQSRPNRSGGAKPKDDLSSAELGVSEAGGEGADESVKPLIVEVDRELSWGSDEGHRDLSEVVLTGLELSERLSCYEEFIRESNWKLRISTESVGEDQKRIKLGHWPVLSSGSVRLEFVVDSANEDGVVESVMLSGSFDGPDEGVTGLVHLVSLKLLTLRPVLGAEITQGASSVRVRVEILKSAFDACESETLLDCRRQGWKNSMMNVMTWLRPEATTLEARYGVNEPVQLKNDLVRNEETPSKIHARFDASGFYEAIKPSKKERMLEEELPDLLPELRPYQRRAAYWMHDIRPDPSDQPVSNRCRGGNGSSRRVGGRRLGRLKRFDSAKLFSVVDVVVVWFSCSQCESGQWSVCEFRCLHTPLHKWMMVGIRMGGSVRILAVNVECDIELRDDEDEDEDEDEALSPDASSSLSSEIEERDLIGDVTDSSFGYLHNEDDETIPRDKEIGREQGSEYQKNVASVSQSEKGSMRDHETGFTSGVDVDDYGTAVELGTREDAETDDDDDFPNVDDEEEYRKFLAAVLLGGDGDGMGDQENQTVDDEDEDEENDADFELEIEEALESDLDERINRKEKDETGRRPETRQNKPKKASSVKDSGHLQNVQRHFRPLVPIMPSAPISLLSAMDRTSIQPCLSSSPENAVTSAVFDPARQQIALQVQGLIMDLIDKRNQALAQRREPHPYFCFGPPYVHPSVLCELPKTWPIQLSYVQPASMDSFGQIPPSHSNSVPPPAEGSHNEDQEDTLQKKERVFWLPHIIGPLYSILDAAPLSLAGEYINEVKTAMKDYQQRYLKDTFDTQFERESMFPSFLDCTLGCADPKTGKVASCSDGSSSLPNCQSLKKTFAAELIENSKKQPVALVPRVIGKLAQRFYAIFNPALYPRKPPPVVIANRVLFTTTEDELLALGMMEYNTDWKAIQQRFLPCKSKHQIFVRQKNCCSSKAPDNPIKAVRRMKTSPLTVDEVARIREGLRIYKLDWFSIWKFIVPYRDPSLLARQWRIALGTQKSYKTDAINRERRRLYEANRRRSKAKSQALSEKRDNNNSADDSIENEDEAFVHEAFLEDWRPRASSTMLSQPQYFNLEGKNVSVRSQAQAYHLNQPSTPLRVNCHGNIENGPDAQRVGYQFTPDAMKLKYPISGATSNSAKSTFCSRPYRARRSRKTQMVKLAPDLPALNLPPSVRVISQSAFKSYHSVASVKVTTSGSGGAPNLTPTRLSFTRAGASSSNMGMPSQNSLAGPSVTNMREDNGEADLEMHPLLFQSSGDGSGLPYHPLKWTSGMSSSFSFFNGNQPQADRSLFHKEQDASMGTLYNNLKSVETTSASCGIDFHPLLRRADGAECSAGNAASPAQLSISSELVKETAAGNNSSSFENANELNLEIQLSSSSKGHQFRVRKDGAGNKRVGSIASASAFERTITPKGTRNLPNSPGGNNPNIHYFLDSSTNDCTYRMDLAGEHSLDIVMEQEELSDSDEEDNDIEEDVEFECEEMTDSEPDVESDFEVAAQAQNKEVVNPESNTFTVTESHSEQQALEDASHFHPCLTLNWAGQDKDSQAGIITNQIIDNSVPCQPSKSSKKRTPIRKRSRATAKTPSSEPLVLSSSNPVHLKKPGKRNSTPSNPTKPSSVAPIQCGLRELRDRIDSVKNTQKITEAMKLVAAAKVRRAQEAVVNGRPFSETLVEVLYNINEQLQTEDVDTPLASVRPVKKVALVVITGDRGLCSGFNNMIIKKAEARIRDLTKLGLEYTVISVGKKGDSYFLRRPYIPVDKFLEGGNLPTAKEAQAIADDVFSLFVSEEVDKVELLYTKFVSLVKSDPVIHTLLPLSPKGEICHINGICVDAAEDEFFRLTTKEGKLTVERDVICTDLYTLGSGSEKIHQP